MSNQAAKAIKGKSRLGRGLSSLISVSSSPVEAEVPALPVRNEIKEVNSEKGAGAGEIALNEIVANPHQPRRVFNEASIAELAASIKSTGLIQPLVVRKGPGGGYQLIAGERRWRAAKMAGLTMVPAVVKEVDSFMQAQMALIENVQREDLNPIDRALGYRALIDQLGLTQAELAGRLGEDRSSIANFLRLLELAEGVRNLVRDGQLSVGHAKLLAGVGDAVEQQRLAALVISQGLSVRNLERLMQEGDATPLPTSHAGESPSAHFQDLEKSLSRQLGMRVQVKSSGKKGGKGKLVVYYGSLDQFDELLQRLNVSAD
ncbi:MAG TPA: ParB/RepB/Spo0J family partition protein [Tepidisphaeraceae bacterium]|jgi:ParB family chromosome partitioning protein|nr:ParB/RepB/Spo0J family partition protein [Tepidisphaeraceae bacterium]